MARPLAPHRGRGSELGCGCRSGIQPECVFWAGKVRHAAPGSPQRHCLIAAEFPTPLVTRVCDGDAVVEVRRFHVESGPDALFQRVHQIFVAPRQLKTHGRHLADRLAQHSGPRQELESFDPRRWDLVLVEARRDTGKFVSTTWRRQIEGREWWVVIGFQDTVRTLYEATPGKRGMGEVITRSGPDWNHVAEVNSGLVTAHLTS